MAFCPMPARLIILSRRSGERVYKAKSRVWTLAINCFSSNFFCPRKKDSSVPETARGSRRFIRNHHRPTAQSGGSARRWRAIFGGPPEISSNPFLPPVQNQQLLEPILDVTAALVVGLDQFLELLGEIVAGLVRTNPFFQLGADCFRDRDATRRRWN